MVCADIFWPFLRRSAPAPTIKALRGTVAIFDNPKGRPFPYGGPLQRNEVPLRRHPFPLQASLIVQLSVEGLGTLVVRVPGCP